jgi:hypothetical protein
LSWWERASPGAPMVGPSMIRPLYPPDAAERGKRPSADGEDIRAIKRAVSRSGHWHWDTFDDAYSNGFAHGRSGNVSENGLAGLQRQNHIEATGWMGEHTYNLIRSALVPDGLPHAGEHILDNVAIDLLEEYARAGSSGTTRELALDKARSFLGYQESPPGTNGSMFGAWYGLNFEPWCAMFVSYCFEHVAHGSPTFIAGVCYAYVPFIVDDAINGRNGLNAVDDPIPGDLVCYDWGGDGGLYDHVGIFEAGDPFGFDAIEGNTSVSNNSNGGEVMRRTRSVYDAAGTTFVRVAE